MPRGAKPGERRGGRQKGAKNKVTIERETATAAIVAEAKAKGVQPLEVLLGSMRQAWAQGDCKQASFFAAQAAPYIHPRLSSSEVKIDDKRTVNEFSLNDIAAELRRRGIAPKAAPNLIGSGKLDSVHRRDVPALQDG